MEDSKPSMVVLPENDDEVQNSQPEFPMGMAPKMLKLVKALNDLESKVEPLISKQHHEVFSKLSPTERAKVGLMEVYTINSLFWVLMKTSGENIDATLRDDYKVEMGRLKETQGKLAELELRAQRPHMDVRVASRLIHHGLGVNQRRETQGVEMEQDFVRQGREQTWDSHSQTWDSHSHNEYQEGSAEQHENQDEEPQPVAFTKSKKRNKKLPLDSSQPTHIYFGEEGDHPSSYQGSGEDSFRTSQKVRNKKFKKVSSVETSGSAESESSVGNILKKKKMSKKSSETNGKLKKNKMKTESDVTVSDVNGLQVADSGGVTAIKGKKRQKVKDEAIDDSEEECQYMSEEDKEVTSSLSQKKMKMKAKEEKTVTQADISAFLDTTRARINYEFEDDQDLSNKSRNWYEQGWT